MSAQNPPKTYENAVQIRFSPRMADRINDVSKHEGLNRMDTMRLALCLGLHQLEVHHSIPKAPAQR